MRQHSVSTWRGVDAATCLAWPLPADATCATVARNVFKEAVAEIGLKPDLVDDCVLMASELAANTLHARKAAGAGGGGDRLVSVTTDMGGEPITSAGPAPSITPVHPELWLYLRGMGIRRELVCKVFDGYRGWLREATPAPETPETPETKGDLDDLDAQALTGRGLEIVHELSGGRWGYHPTRARVSGWDVRGKAVWFAVPAPLAHARLVDVTGLHEYTLSADVTATRAQGQLSARQAATRLRTMLDERGFDGRLAQVDRLDVSVLHIRRGLTVWCRSGTVSLSTPDGSVQQWDHADLIDATEQTVRWYEELDCQPLEDDPLQPTQGQRSGELLPPGCSLICEEVCQCTTRPFRTSKAPTRRSPT